MKSRSSGRHSSEGGGSLGLADPMGSGAPRGGHRTGHECGLA